MENYNVTIKELPEVIVAYLRTVIQSYDDLFHLMPEVLGPEMERLGCKYCGSPRHADIVLITGPLTARVKDKVLRVWNEIPEPKVTVAVGICPISGGVFREGYSIEGPVDRYLPIDVNVPGCPPRPQAIMEGVLEAVAIWRERMEG